MDGVAIDDAGAPAGVTCTAGRLARPSNIQADLRDAFAAAGLVSPAVAEAGQHSVAAGRLAGSPPW
jgi:hypothetical protein